MRVREKVWKLICQLIIPSFKLLSNEPNFCQEVYLCHQHLQLLQSVVPSLLYVVGRPVSDSRAASPDFSNGGGGDRDPASAVVTEIILVQQGRTRTDDISSKVVTTVLTAD